MIQVIIFLWFFFEPCAYENLVEEDDLWTSGLKDTITLLMRILQARREKLANYPSNKLAFKSVRIPSIPNCRIPMYMCTVVEAVLMDKDITLLSEEHVRYFTFLGLKRLLSLGIVMGRHQYGPLALFSILNNAAYRRLFADIHSSWLASHEGFAKGLVELGIISKAAFEEIEFSDDLSAESSEEPEESDKADKEKQSSKPRKKSAADVEDPSEVALIVKSSKRKQREMDDDEKKVSPPRKKSKATQKADNEKESSKPRKRSATNNEADEEEDSANEKAEEETGAIEKGEYKCIDVTCEKTYTNLANMKQHYFAEHKERTYPCVEPGCDKSFTRKNDRKRHVERVHRKRAPGFRCEQCDIICLTNFNLQRHVKHMHS